MLDIHTDFLTDAQVLVSSGAILDCMDNHRHKLFYIVCVPSCLHLGLHPCSNKKRAIHGHAKSTQGGQSS